MKSILVKTFIKDYKNIKDPKVRLAYGVLSGLVGVISNFILFALKITIGIISFSIAIIADAINNLSDAATSIITLIGFKLAGKPADDEHPFGHDRLEYVTGLIISIVILVVGAFLVKTSIDKIIAPDELVFSNITIIILSVSIVIKIWQSLFYFNNSKIINSKTLKANALDSLNDFIITSVILASFIVNKLFGLNVDGYVGLVVALFVIYSGISLIKDTASLLVGEVPSEELVKQIKNKILSVDEILGMHDLIIHCYGPLKRYATVHVEVNSTMTIDESHYIIDKIEDYIKNDLNTNIVIHIDPVDVDCEKRNKYLKIIKKIVKDINNDFNIHDFRIIKEKNKSLILFDLVIPNNYKQSKEILRTQVVEEMKKIDKNINMKFVIETEIIKTDI